jgi:hypothetical protein
MALFWRQAMGSVRDLAPIILVICFFQIFILQRPVAELLALSEGALLVVLGLTLFVYGLELALFPVGEALAHGLAEKGSVQWLVFFAFLLGFGTTIAEPALIAVAAEAAAVASAAGVIADTDLARDQYTLALRLTVACSVAVALVLGIARIIAGWSLATMIITGYGVVVLITFFAPAEIIGIAYDAGGVTTSTVTVPLVTALGIGLASSLGGRNPMTDGFGLIALASLTPIVFVLTFGIVVAWI